MSRSILVGLVLVSLISASSLFAADIPQQDLEEFDEPCSMALQQVMGVRVITWDAVSGASSYRVGRVSTGSGIETLADTSNLTFNDTTWSTTTCYDYVVVAYDASSVKICAAIVEEVGNCLN